MPVMPMFPLGSVLLPTVVLPLHVFEPRYRQLVQDCRAGSGEFGVVLMLFLVGLPIWFALPGR